MKRTNRTDRTSAFSHPCIRSSLVEPCFDFATAGYSDPASRLPKLSDSRAHAGVRKRVRVRPLPLPIYRRGHGWTFSLSERCEQSAGTHQRPRLGWCGAMLKPCPIRPSRLAAFRRPGRSRRPPRASSSATPTGRCSPTSRLRQGEDGGAPFAVVLNYSHGERRTHCSAQEGDPQCLA